MRGTAGALPLGRLALTSALSGEAKSGVGRQRANYRNRSGVAVDALDEL